MFLGMDMKFSKKIFNATLSKIHGIGLSYMHQSMGTSVRPKPPPGD